MLARFPGRSRALTGARAAAAATCLLAAAPAAAQAATTDPFVAGSTWNAPLSSSAGVTANSAGLVSDLQRQVTKYGTWINTHQYSVPVYTVPADQPTVRVTLDKSHAPLQAQWEAVPLPPDAKPAKGTDGHLVVHQPSTNTLWEFWRLYKHADGTWHAAWGGRILNASTSWGAFDSYYGATATSLSLLGGLMRPDEVRAGVIDHALALALPETKKTEYVWPAQRTDGSYTHETAIPQGTRFRLDPSLDIAALGLPKQTAIIARAAQRYGMVVRDRAGAVTLFGEDMTRTGTNPWPSIWGTQWPSNFMAKFPWSKLQVVPPSASELASVTAVASRKASRKASKNRRAKRGSVRRTTRAAGRTRASARARARS